MSFKITENVNDKTMNNLTTFKFITYNGKMSINNMIKCNTHTKRIYKV